MHVMWPIEEPLLQNAPLQQSWSAGLPGHGSDKAASFGTFAIEGAHDCWLQSKLGAALNSNILCVDCGMLAFDRDSQIPLEVLGQALATLLRRPKEKWHGKLYCSCSCLATRLCSLSAHGIACLQEPFRQLASAFTFLRQLLLGLQSVQVYMLQACELIGSGYIPTFWVESAWEDCS